MDSWGVLPVVMGSEVRDQVRNGATVVRGGEMGRRRRRGTARTTQLQCWHIIHLEYRWMYTDTDISLFTHRWRWEAELIALQKHSYWLLKCLSACVCVFVCIFVFMWVYALPVGKWTVVSVCPMSWSILTFLCSGRKWPRELLGDYLHLRGCWRAID